MAKVKADTLSVNVPDDMMVDKNLCDDEAKTLVLYREASSSRRVLA